MPCSSAWCRQAKSHSGSSPLPTFRQSIARGPLPYDDHYPAHGNRVDQFGASRRPPPSPLSLSPRPTQRPRGSGPVTRTSSMAIRGFAMACVRRVVAGHRGRRRTGSLSCHDRLSAGRTVRWSWDTGHVTIAADPRPAKPRLLQDGRDMLVARAGCILLAGPGWDAAHFNWAGPRDRIPSYDAAQALRADAKTLGSIRLPHKPGGWPNPGSRRHRNGRKGPRSSTPQRGDLNRGIHQPDREISELACEQRRRGQAGRPIHSVVMYPIGDGRRGGNLLGRLRGFETVPSSRYGRRLTGPGGGQANGNHRCLKRRTKTNQDPCALSCHVV